MPKISKTSLVFALSALFVINLHILAPKTEKLQSPEEAVSRILTVERNSLSAFSPLPEPKVEKKLNVIVTAYSSTVWQTDDDPFITASGSYVKDGIVANNLFPFGTRIRMPEIYGDKIFVVEDRMNRRKSNYHFDIWFSTYNEAKNFGVKDTYVEVLEI